MADRGFVVLAQNSYTLKEIDENPILRKEYEGIKVDVWYDEVEHLAGQHVWVEDNVYRLKSYQERNTEFDLDNADIFLKNVRLIDDTNQNLLFFRARTGDIVLKNNFLYYVEEEDNPRLDLDQQYKGINVDVWYDEVEHLAGQHVWYKNAVYKLKQNTYAGTEFDKNNVDLLIDNVKLYDDENKSLKFNRINVYDIILSNNKVYEVRPALDTDYILQACLLAMSIKATNPKEKISVITNDEVPYDYKKLFDKIIPIPFGDEAKNSDWKVENRWKIYYASPYEKTIVLDTDILVLQSIDSWWKYLEKYDLYFTSKVFTYRHEEVKADFYRKTFVENDLPNLYSGFHYFRKSKFAADFYKMLETVVKNWEDYYKMVCPKVTPPRVSIDVCAAIAAKLLMIETKITNKNTSFMKFVHMKPEIQNWNQTKIKWQDCIGTYITRDCKIKLGNHLQSGLLHYTEKDFVNEKIIDRYRNLLYV